MKQKVSKILFFSGAALFPFVFMNIWGAISIGSGAVSAFILIFPIIGMLVFVYVLMPLWFKIIWCGGCGGR